MSTKSIAITALLALSATAVVGWTVVSESAPGGLEEPKGLSPDRPPLTPPVFDKSEVRHWAIYLDLEGGTIRLSSREAEERPGPPPFSPPLKGAVTLICKDAQRQALSELTIHDPTVVRRVAGETEPPPEKEREIKQFELLLPPLKSIEFVEIVWPDKRPRAEFDVGDVLEKIKSGG